MKNITSLFLISSIALTTTACNTMKTSENKPENPPVIEASLANNPFMKKSTLQYEAPEFNKIKTADFAPAFNYGLEQHLYEINKIANNPEKATFENTLVALEKSGEVLKRAQTVFYNLTSADTNDELQALEEKYAPIFAAHYDKIYLNDQLYKRIKAIPSSGLQGEDKRLLEYYLQNFEIAGANLSPEKKAELKDVNQELATLSTQFSNKLLAARKDGGVFFSDVKELDGLSTDEIAAAATDAEKAGQKGKISFSTPKHNATTNVAKLE